MRDERLNSKLDGCRTGSLERARVPAQLLCALAVLAVSTAACSGPDSEQLSCDDVLPAGSVDFTSLQALVQRPPRGGGCLAGGCHSASAQSAGIRLDEPKIVYEELSTRPALFYGVLASREMPQRGRPWSLADLRVFRSWYCDGAFPP